MKKKFDFQANFNNENYGRGLRCVIICALAVLLVTGINFFAGAIPTKIANIDLSVSRIHSISLETEEKISSLDKKVEIYLVTEPGEEDKNTVQILNLYSDLNDNISVTKVDPALYPELIQQTAGDKTVNNNSIILLCGEKKQIIDYGDYFSGNKFLLEDYLNSGIDYVSGEYLKKIYALTGHGEAELSEEMTSFLGLDGFESEELSLVKTSAIPQDAAGIIVNGATSDLTEREAAILLDYMKKGGKLVLSTGYTDESMLNWKQITEYYGASAEKGYVMEGDESLFVKENPRYIMPYIFTDSNETITSGVKYVLMPDSTGIVLEENDALRDTLKVSAILKTSEKAASLYTNIFTGSKDYVEGPFNLGICAEEKTQTGTSKFVWFSSKYMTDQDINSFIGGGNLTMFLNAISWACEDNPVASIHGKTVSTQFLTVSDAYASVIKIVMIGVIPFIAIAAGIFVYFRRKRR